MISKYPRQYFMKLKKTNYKILSQLLPKRAGNIHTSIYIQLPPKLEHCKISELVKTVKKCPKLPQLKSKREFEAMFS